MYDVIIIGAGCAGLTSAIYARRANKKVLVLEKNAYGGQIVNAKEIHNYPALMDISGFDFATNLYNQALKLGSEIKFEEALEIKDKEVITTSNSYKCNAIILAIGVKNRNLNIPGEIEYIGKGVSYCAVCDGMFYKNKIVAVVGGGNTAIEDALYLSDICKKVYIIHRNENLSASEMSLDEVKSKKNVEFILNTNVISINGKDKVNSIDIKDNNDNINNIKIDGVFIAIGHTPQTSKLLDNINKDKNGYIISDDNLKTNIDGIYVAGDARQKDLRQLVTAASDGAIAATNAIKYIK